MRHGFSKFSGSRISTRHWPKVDERYRSNAESYQNSGYQTLQRHFRSLQSTLVENSHLKITPRKWETPDLCANFSGQSLTASKGGRAVASPRECPWLLHLTLFLSFLCTSHTSLILERVGVRQTADANEPRRDKTQLVRKQINAALRWAFGAGACKLRRLLYNCTPVFFLFQIFESAIRKYFEGKIS